MVNVMFAIWKGHGEDYKEVVDIYLAIFAHDDKRLMDLCQERIRFSCSNSMLTFGEIWRVFISLMAKVSFIVQLRRIVVIYQAKLHGILLRTKATMD